MIFRILFILCCLQALVACGGCSDTKKDDDLKAGDKQNPSAMRGYKLPESIVILDVKE